MISTNKYCFAAIVVAGLLQSCCRQLPDRYLTHYEKSLLPYEAGQILYITNQFGDEAVLTVTTFGHENSNVETQSGPTTLRGSCYHNESVRVSMSRNLQGTIPVSFKMNPYREDNDIPSSLNISAFGFYDETYMSSEWIKMDTIEVSDHLFEDVLLADTLTCPQYFQDETDAVEFYLHRNQDWYAQFLPMAKYGICSEIASNMFPPSSSAATPGQVIR